MTTAPDEFQDIARYYDGIMEHVDYDRWFMITTQLAGLLPRGFRHLDAACGTGTLLERLRRSGWRSVGMDLSFAMLHAGRKGGGTATTCAGDIRAMPFKASVDYITCLFDSMNFLLETADIRRALDQFHDVLRPGGLLYFDVVTERMVFDHYDGQAWVETNGRFSTTWENEYDRHTGIITTKIRVNTGPSCQLLERIYPQNAIERALDQAGFSILAAYDAHSWKSPNRKTVRIDFLAVKGDPRPCRKGFRALRDEIRRRVV